MLIMRPPKYDTYTHQHTHTSYKNITSSIEFSTYKQKYNNFVQGLN